MTETAEASDMATGLGLLFGLVVVLASIGAALAAIRAAGIEEPGNMQLLSGLTMAVAMLAGGIAIVVIHVYE